MIISSQMNEDFIEWWICRRICSRERLGFISKSRLIWEYIIIFRPNSIADWSDRIMIIRIIIMIRIMMIMMIRMIYRSFIQFNSSIIDMINEENIDLLIYRIYTRISEIHHHILEHISHSDHSMFAFMTKNRIWMTSDNLENKMKTYLYSLLIPYKTMSYWILCGGKSDQIEMG